ncbi:MAG: P1 family peptidase [Vicinamibacteria bacterium]|nr:P1 family peptidase [Vicinamibacteria bacterium]
MKRATLTLFTFAATTSFAGGTITDVPGIKVGSITLTEKPTGCTVVIADGGATPGVSQRGGAPGTRETDLMDPVNMIEKANAIVLTGGSAYGLDAASGTMKWLEEQNIGFPIGGGVVPIVGAAVLFDLPFDGKPKIRPGADCGYKAAAAATTDPVVMGTVGAGAGATVGKAGGPGRRPMKGGLGSASIKMPNGLVVGAIVAVNSVGDIIDPYTGKVVAGSINADDTFADVRQLIRSGASMQPRPRAGENTTIGLVATNAKMTKAQVTKMAQMADDGYARAINPAHTMGDGDTIFALATGRWDGEANPTLIGALAAEAMADALLAAVREATGAGGVKAVRDLKPAAGK